MSTTEPPGCPLPPEQKLEPLKACMFNNKVICFQKGPAFGRFGHNGPGIFSGCLCLGVSQKEKSVSPGSSSLFPLSKHPWFPSQILSVSPVQSSPFPFNTHNPRRVSSCPLPSSTRPTAYLAPPRSPAALSSLRAPHSSLQRNWRLPRRFSTGFMEAAFCISWCHRSSAAIG